MRTARSFPLRFVVLVVALGVGCKPAGCVANVFGDVVGATGDAHCDRRFVPAEKQAASFCQEIIDTLATSQFKDDCDEKFKAASGDGPCGKETVIAGCKNRKINDDGSEVYDWYYDVSQIVSERGDASGPDGGPTFETSPTNKDEVKKLCADKGRYEDGADYVDP